MDSRELNAKLLAEIAELRKENAEIPELREKLQRFVEAENAKLRQIIEENARRETENNELKSRVGELERYSTELENRIAMLEQGSLVAGQSQHDNSSNNNSSNFNSVAEHHEKSLEDVCSSKQDRETDDFSSQGTCQRT
ncbi:24153_t:CDS:1 [Gigaspora margarita]|uniref:24153_t:CDS:1 n=1 Tax=Gigaspora margarita TaxID=4874 RepID=A0ABN7VGN4_GIGMA|nr:24153_t:CDS:1 [Gigaspora margarita]